MTIFNSLKYQKPFIIFSVSILFFLLVTPFIIHGKTVTDSATKFPTVTDTASKSGGGSETIKIPNPLKTTSFTKLIDRLVNWLLVIGTPILVLMIIIGAFQIMTGAGNPEQITKGRQTVTWAIVGYALLILSKSVTFIIAELLKK